MLFYLIASLSYILGSVPFGLIITRAKGINLRIIGSGNIGATNVMRTGHKILAVMTLLFDICKGLLSVYIAEQYLYEQYEILICTFLVVLGHMFPIWIKCINGGKGVATTLGILIGFDLSFHTYISLLFILTWVIVFYIFRYSSLASLVATIVIALLFLIVMSKEEFAMLLAIAILICCKHYRNIINIIQGTEYKFFKKI
ncbi:glycerol-3-phosphate 1-O-acyltransferase PlsY [Wolbachia endosymbiont of Howardula sp.]|uniref:glycerol-3-phosphate 1-O-acyltransferase PlsY n=1 Tax=Wolbachia endosymbiont of Howardula sp. TaxID=2916816 RepID=UPI00217D1104|nr:glycerol-3-phosphate 1-O-acyltransferase PlsY [Wolbachia endosymbiont of Howardula sp.]UWI83328.1 glycerol-3-phosphate 1-O-acyltransferase PlsY [Wolbachia endosymbiont of Howardula sp.]